MLPQTPPPPPAWVRLRRAWGTLAVQVLVLFAAATLLPLAISIAQIRSAAATVEARAVEEAAGVANLAAHDVADLIRGVRATGETLGRLEEFWAGDDQARDRMLEALAAPEPVIDSLQFYTYDGQQRGASTPAARRVRQPLSREGFVLEAARSGHLQAATEPATTPGNAPILFVAAPIHEPNDDSPSGLLLAGLRLDRLAAIWDGVPLPEQSRVLLADTRQGRILSGNTVGMPRSGQLLRPAALEAIQAEAGSQPMELGGAAYLRGWQHVPGVPWVVIVDMPSEVVLSPVYANAARQVVVNAGIAALVLAFLLLLWRGLLGRLRVLQEAAGRWARGEWGHRASLPSTDELARLARAFDRMAEDLQRASMRREALLRVARRFAAETEARSVLRTLLEEAVGLLDAQDGGVARWDATSGRLVQVENFLTPTNVGTVLSLERSASGQAVLRRAPVIVNDYQQTVGAATPVGYLGAEAVVAVPLLHEGRVLGTLAIASVQPQRRFTDEDAQMLELLASVGAATLESLGQARLDGVRLAARTAEHEMNNRLSRTVGYSELLSHNPALPAELRPVVEEILQAAREAAEIIRQLRDVSQIEETDWGSDLGTTIDLSLARAPEPPAADEPLTPDESPTAGDPLPAGSPPSSGSSASPRTLPARTSSSAPPATT